MDFRCELDSLGWREEETEEEQRDILNIQYFNGQMELIYCKRELRFCKVILKVSDSLYDLDIISVFICKEILKSTVILNVIMEIDI